MFTNLMQRTKKIIQEKYLKADHGTNAISETIDEVQATDQQLDEKAQELKDQVYGRYTFAVRFPTVMFVITVPSFV